MDYLTIVFWFLCFSCVTGLVVVLKRGWSAGVGWSVLFIAILLTGLTGWLTHQNSLIYIAAALWLLLVMLPSLLGTLYYRRFLQQDYPTARRLALVIKGLHPADGWREQPEIVRAVELAQRGELTAATAALKRLERSSSMISLSAMLTLFRLTGEWEEMLAWAARSRHNLEGIPQLVYALLRARGETGDLRGLVEVYDRHNHEIGKLTPAPSRDLCRLMLFAFCGRRELAEDLFRGSLAVLPASTKQFWLATADLAAGNHEGAKNQLEALLPTVDPPQRLAIDRRLLQCSSRRAMGPGHGQPDDEAVVSSTFTSAAPLEERAGDTKPSYPSGDLPRKARSLILDAGDTAVVERVISAAAREQSHDDSFGARPTLFSALARGTQLLITLNLLVFGVELWLGGSTNPEALYRLGALFRPAVQAGEWWRLVAALFLHFGPLHLAMNMVALWMLGPFVEFALGLRRFLLVYLLAGVGSMAFVLAFASGPAGEQVTVGASGCVMGLIGATGGLMLRGWWQERARAAQRRLIAMLAIVAMQVAFDALVPQVSMAAHLSGAAIGFVATLLVRDRLRDQRWRA